MRPRFAPDAAGEILKGEHAIVIDGYAYTYTQARALGFAPEDTSDFGSRWVQANGFMVRGLIDRGDAQKFSTEELLGLVAAFLAERGVRLQTPDILEAFCFNYGPRADLDEARIRVRMEQERAAAERGVSIGIGFVEVSPDA